MTTMPQRRSPRPSPRSSSRRPPAVQTYRRRRPRRRFPWVQALVLAVVVVLIGWLAYGALAGPKRGDKARALRSASNSAKAAKSKKAGATEPKPKRSASGSGNAAQVANGVLHPSFLGAEKR